MLDPKKLLDELLGSNLPGTQSTVRGTADRAIQMAKDNPLAAGAIAAVLLGTGTGRSVTGSALKMGGLAAIAGLAYKAYQSYQTGAEPVKPAREQPELLPAPTDTTFHPSQAPQGEGEFALSLVRAMIAAAKADGHIDDAERQKIADRLSLSGMGGEAGEFLLAEIDKPADLDAIVASAKTEAQRVELYTASRLAIAPDSRAERGYLDLLAGRLELPDSLVDHIEATVAAASTPVPAPSPEPVTIDVSAQGGQAKSPW